MAHEFATNFPLGSPIPDVPHAVSISLPKWQHNVGYEEGDPQIIKAMKSGYPRFVFNPFVKRLFTFCLERFGTLDQECLVLEDKVATQECRIFMKQRITIEMGQEARDIRLVQFMLNASEKAFDKDEEPPVLYIILFPKSYSKIAKSFWQHTGRGISSRFAEFCLIKLQILFPVLPAQNRPPTLQNQHLQMERRIQDLNLNQALDASQAQLFVEERFGRNLSVSEASNCRLMLCKRIAGVLGDFDHGTIQKRVGSVDETHVRLFSCGMSAIHFTHRVVTKLFPGLKTVQFGFPYIDTLKIQEKFGSGCHFFGNGDENDLAQLKELLKTEKISALYCEFPSNPLLKSNPLQELWDLSQKYGFCFIVDETIGNFINTNVLPFCHIIVSSLTKVFSGDSNVMGGSIVLNPETNLYNSLFKITSELYRDTVWKGDVIFLERNSRTFQSRVLKINFNTLQLCESLKNHPKIMHIYYPKYTTPEIYAKHSTNKGYYGGLFSIVLQTEEMAQKFYDLLPISKGPSLGTNFTLACPYTILAHYFELDWAKSFGVNKSLIRISVGLEDADWLVKSFHHVLDAI